MEEFIVTLRCQDRSLMRTINKGGGSIIEKGIIHDDQGICFQAIVSAKLLDDIRSKVIIEKQENIKDYDQRKFAMVGKGNRYLDQ